ncbi:MAG: hypothetical protein ACJA13_004207 [Paraglaciecola sp.]|jgi:hypothetical protein
MDRQFNISLHPLSLNFLATYANTLYALTSGHNSLLRLSRCSIFSRHCVALTGKLDHKPDLAPV